MGVENVDARDDEQAMVALCTHLGELFRLRALRRSVAVLIPENNLANAGDRLKISLRAALRPAPGALPSEHLGAHRDVVQQVAGDLKRRVTFLRGVDHRGRVGVWTNNRTKVEMARALAVRIRDGLLCFHEDLVCVASGPNFGPLQAKQELMRQLRSYERIIELDAKGELRCEKYSGKRSGWDDLCIAIQAMNLFSRTWMDAPRLHSSEPLA